MRDASWIRISTVLGGLLLGCGGPEPDGAAAADGDCAVKVEAHGGRAVASPLVVNVYWGEYWETPLAADNAFLAAGAVPRQAWDEVWAKLAASPTLWASLGEYHVGSGSWGGSGTLVDGDDAGEPIPEERIQAALEHTIAAGGLPGSASAIYVIYLAPGRTAAADYVGFGGARISAHHGAYRGTGGALRIYAVIEAWNATMGGHSVAASHEIAEAVTNPDGSGFWNSVHGEEIADLCIGFDARLGAETSAAADFFFLVQRPWSQQSCDCGDASPVSLAIGARTANDGGEHGLSGRPDDRAPAGGGAR